MRVAEVPARDVRPLIAEVHADLIALLASLRDAEWAAPTEAGRWTVKDVALHLLDGDLSQLSIGRDEDPSGLLDDGGGYRRFVAALDAKNQRWVEAARGLSPRVVTGLLRWSGEQVGQYYATVDLTGPAHVSWASDGTVPMWLDLAREMTERWVHQQHIRDAVGRPGDHARFLPAVLATFVWAFPHQYRPDAPPGTAVQLDFGAAAGGGSPVRRRAGCWTKAPPRAPRRRSACRRTWPGASSPGCPCRPASTPRRETNAWPRRCSRSGASSSEPGRHPRRRQGIGAACAAFTAWL